MDLLYAIYGGIGIILISFLVIYRKIKVYKRTAEIILHHTINRFITIVWKVFEITAAEKIIVQKNLEDFANGKNERKKLKRTSDGYNYGLVDEDKKTVYVGCDIFKEAVIQSDTSSEYKIILNLIKELLNKCSLKYHNGTIQPICWKEN